MKNKITQEWENATMDLTEYFINKYFGKSKSIESYWIADDIGGCLVVNDYFFNLGDIVDFIKYRYTPTKMFEYYDYALKAHELGAEYVVNIKNYKKMK